MCIEHDLSYIQNPKPHSKGRFLHYGQWLGEGRQPSYQARLRAAIVVALEQRPTDFDSFLQLMEEAGYKVTHGRAGVVSFLVSGQERATRLRASTLGDGFGPEDIRAVIAGERPIPELPAEAPTPARRVNLIIDIQERLRSGKGPDFEKWAKIYNLKQMAAALQFLQEHGLTDYAALEAQTTAAVEHFDALAEKLQINEAALSKTSELMGAVVDYAKTRDEFATYRAARAAMNALLDGGKLPPMAKLKEERRKLAAEKKALYTEYHVAQRDMREALAIKTNIDHLLGITVPGRDKEQAR